MNELLSHNLFYNYPMAAYVYIMICCFRLDVVKLPWTKPDDNSEFPYEDHFGPERRTTKLATSKLSRCKIV